MNDATKVDEIRKIVGDVVRIELPAIYGEDLVEDAAVLDAAVLYAFRTGHRLVLDYRNERGRHTEGRKVSPTTPMVKNIRGERLFSAYDVELKEPRTFYAARLLKARFDG